jgi:hypothetical protein
VGDGLPEPEQGLWSDGKTWYWYDNWPGKVIEKLTDGWTRPTK